MLFCTQDVNLALKIDKVKAHMICKQIFYYKIQKKPEVYQAFFC
jgi:hypothetical protein